MCATIWIYLHPLFWVLPVQKSVSFNLGTFLEFSYWSLLFLCDFTFRTYCSDIRYFGLNTRYFLTFSLLLSIFLFLISILGEIFSILSWTSSTEFFMSVTYFKYLKLKHFCSLNIYTYVFVCGFCIYFFLDFLLWFQCLIFLRSLVFFFLKIFSSCTDSVSPGCYCLFRSLPFVLETFHVFLISYVVYSYLSRGLKS